MPARCAGIFFVAAPHDPVKAGTTGAREEVTVHFWNQWQCSLR
jgi:hypothetical protein